MIVSLHSHFTLKQTLKSPHYNTRLTLCPAHCISFTRTCLSISENANIIAIKCTLNNLFCVLIDIFLSWLSTKAGIKWELFNNYWWIFNLLIFFKFNLKCELVLYRTYFLTAHVVFIVTQRPDPAINSDFTFDIFNLIMKPFSFYTLKLKFEP